MIWIKEVRSKAQNSLMKMINRDNIEDIIKNIMLIHRIKENIRGLKIYYMYSYEEFNLELEELFYEEVILKTKYILGNKKNRDEVKNI